MNTYRERMVHAARKRRNKAIGRKKKIVFSSTLPFPNYESNCPMRNIPSLNERVLGAIPKRKAYTSTHTIAPAFNKGPYMVIPESCIKDIGK
jgi:hypothetical protein